MFTRYRVPLKKAGVLKVEEVNGDYELLLDFRSAFKEARRLAKFSSTFSTAFFIGAQA